MFVLCGCFRICDRTTLKSAMYREEVNKVLHRYADKNKRAILKKEILADNTIARKHIEAFDELKKVCALNSTEKKCYKFIKFWGKIK